MAETKHCYLRAATYMMIHFSNLEYLSTVLKIPISYFIYKYLFCFSDQAQSTQVDLEGGQSELSRANFLLLEALDEDESGNAEEAIELYSSAVELCLEAVSVGALFILYTDNVLYFRLLRDCHRLIMCNEGTASLYISGLVLFC